MDVEYIHILTYFTGKCGLSLAVYLEMEIVKIGQYEATVKINSRIDEDDDYIFGNGSWNTILLNKTKTIGCARIELKTATKLSSCHAGAKFQTIPLQFDIWHWQSSVVPWLYTNGCYVSVKRLNRTNYCLNILCISALETAGKLNLFPKTIFYCIIQHSCNINYFK